MFELRCRWDESSSPEKEVSIKLGSESSWTDICESFVGYLQACGFTVDAVDVMDCFVEMYGDLAEAKDE